MTDSTDTADPADSSAKPRGSFRTTRGAGYGDLYMMDDQLTGDSRKQKLNERQQAFIQPFIDALPAGAVVADIPCGNGRLTQLTAHRPDLVVLPMDYNQTMLASMPQRSPGAPYLARRARTDVTAMPLADRSVDLLLNFRLVHHIADHATRVRMYRQIARVTRGTVLTTFWTTRCWRYVRKRLLGKKIRGNPITPDQMRACCEEAGLVVDRIVRTDVWSEEECIAVCHPA